MKAAVAVFAVMFVVGLSLAYAQQAEPPSAKTAESAPAAPEPVGQQDQMAFATLQIRARVQVEIIQSLQKELDSTNAEIGRLVQRLQEGGKYEVKIDQNQLVRVLAVKK